MNLLLGRANIAHGFGKHRRSALIYERAALRFDDTILMRRAALEAEEAGSQELTLHMIEQWVGLSEGSEFHAGAVLNNIIQLIIMERGSEACELFDVLALPPSPTTTASMSWLRALIELEAGNVQASLDNAERAFALFSELHEIQATTQTGDVPATPLNSHGDQVCHRMCQHFMSEAHLIRAAALAEMGQWQESDNAIVAAVYLASQDVNYRNFSAYQAALLDVVGPGENAASARQRLAQHRFGFELDDEHLFVLSIFSRSLERAYSTRS